VFLIPTLIYTSRLVTLIPMLYSGSLPHRLGRGSRILSRYEREKGCGTHLRGSRDPAWVLAAAWSPWRLPVSRRRGRRLGRDPGDLRVANGTDRGRRRSSPAAGYASPLDQLGFGVLVGCTARSTLLSVPPAPTSFYMVQGDRGPPAIWAGRGIRAHL
jgi:hypothetical protein